MWRLAVLVIAAAACSRDGGVIIVVDTTPLTKHVRLYVGQGDPQHPLYLQTSDGAAAAPTAKRVYDPTYWARDPYNSTDFVDLDVAGANVSFVFVDNGQHAIPAIIAVGYDASFAVTGTAFIEIPAIADDNNFTQYTLQLHGPVSQLDGASQRQLGLWSANQTPIQDAACAGLVEGSHKAFIVSDGDEDCDGFPTGSDLECDPDAYLSKRAATRDEVSCLATKLDVTTNVSSCYLGGPSCTDGQARNLDACEPTAYCVPDEVCTTCPPAQAGALDCATLAAPTTTTYTCRVSFDTNGNVCSDPLVFERPPTGGFNCNAIAIRTAGGKFADRAAFGSLHFDAKLDEGCNITLQPSGKAPSTPFSGAALLAVELDNANGLGIPVVFAQAAQGCGTPPMKCVAATQVYGPELTQCMARWSAPTEIVELENVNVEISDPSLADAMDELYFTSDTSIVVSKLDPMTNKWGSPAPLFVPLDGTFQSAPNITPDGKTLYFVVTTAAGATTIYRTTRADPMSPWAAPTLVTTLQGAFTITEVSPEETETHFVVGENGIGGTHLVEFVKAGNGYIAQPVAVGVNSMIDTTPFLTPDGLHLYFASDGASGATTTGLEIFVASRNTITEPFARAVWLPELGGMDTEQAPWVSRDGHTMYFASNRNGISQLFVSHR